MYLHEKWLKYKNTFILTLTYYPHHFLINYINLINYVKKRNNIILSKKVNENVK